jgi:hypothetical protein
MSSDSLGPTVTVELELKKFDGEYVEGMEPVEVVRTTETIPLKEFLARMNGGAK